MNKPKRGFSMPIDSWLRSSMNEFLMDTLSAANLESSNLNYNKVSPIINKFLHQELKYDIIIWRLLQYQMWYQRWMAN